jgi:hypothetical protein
VDIVQMVLREIEWDGTDWIDVAEDREYWRDVMNTVRNIWIP